MTHTKKPHPVKGGAKVLTTSRGHGTVAGANRTTGCDSTTRIQKDAISYQSGTDSPSCPLRSECPGRVPAAGFLVSALLWDRGLDSAVTRSHGEGRPGKVMIGSDGPIRMPLPEARPFAWDAFGLPNPTGYV